MYDDEGEWTELADGQGHSLILCDTDGDNNSVANWAESSYNSGVSVEGIDILANPGERNRCLYTVAEVSELNADGQIVFQGDARILGTALGSNLRPAALQFTVTDLMGDGIALFSGEDNFGYEEVVEGNLIYVEGTIVQFNGLAQCGSI